MKNLIVLFGILLFLGCKSSGNLKNQSENNYPKMNLKDLHIEDKAVQTKLLFKAEEGKVVSLQIAAGKQLKEHVSNVPAILVCVSGKGIYRDISGETLLKAGDYVMIIKEVKHEVDAIKDSNFILIK